MPLTLKNFYRQWWQPWANTIAYYPLTSTTTVNDMSWNSRTLTNYSSVSFGTQGGVDCATFNGSNYLEIGSQTLNLTEFTMSCWVRWTNTSARGFLWMGKFNISYECMAVIRNTDNKFLAAPYWEGAGSSSASVSDTWYNVICVYSNNTYTIYVNTEQWSSVNRGVTIYWNSNVLRLGYGSTGENKLYWQLSNVIFENKARTATERQDYFNQTKTLYWIS